jgi:L-ribulose-5-phosphate 3-epimerase
MKNKIGVMQGRLLPKYLGRYQAHPVGNWQEEFVLAKELELDCIEFILDYNEVEKNPLISKGGINEIKKLATDTQVEVKTICADYFMEAPLHSQNVGISDLSSNILINLIRSVSNFGVTEIVIPCVDQSSLTSQSLLDKFVKKLLPIEELAHKYEVNLSLETDLNPYIFTELLENFQSNRVTVNYDIGNSAALGYDISEEFACYGNRISDIHIKDRLLGGGSVVLGDGNADFLKFFEMLKKFNYQGPFIMQAYRDEEGIGIFKKQLEWFKHYLYG